MTQKFVSSTKMGRDGRPVKESYQTQAKGVYGRSSKPELVERKQMYQNTGTGLEKAAHERMYQGKGRKVVMENDRSTNQQNSYNYFKGMRDTDGPDFDREWNSAAKRLGFYDSGKSLPYGSGQPGKYVRSNTHSYNDYGRSNSYMDDNRRGHYVPSHMKNPDMPVILDKADTHAARLQPTIPGGRTNGPVNQNNQRVNNARALPLPPARQRRPRKIEKPMQ